MSDRHRGTPKLHDRGPPHLHPTLQTTLALAVAEEAAEFEHRDLHWGNLLVKPAAPGEALRCRLRGVELEVCGGGPRCTLIDFTLSRLQTAGGALAFCDLAADPELFVGPRANAQASVGREDGVLGAGRLG